MDPTDVREPEGNDAAPPSRWKRVITAAAVVVLAPALAVPLIFTAVVSLPAVIVALPFLLAHASPPR